MTRHHIRSLLACAAMASAPAAMAAEGYDNCTGFIDAVPVVISSQGTWCLRHDVSTAVTEGSAIEIAANNVTIDCNGFKVGGLAAGVATNAAGIETIARNNATVRNCSVRGFRFGIQLSGPGGHLVEDNRVEASTATGIQVTGDGALIRRNTLVDIGGSPTAAITIGIYAEGVVDVQDNTIVGVLPVSTGDHFAYGIRTMNNNGADISGNRVRGVISVGTGAARGIYLGSNVRVTMVDNYLVGDDRPGGIGLRCNNNLARTRDNIVADFPTGISACTDDGYVVSP